MKILFTLLFIISPLVATQASADVPPPPMPDYMKKYKTTNPPPAPGAKKKLQPQSNELPTPSTSSKFLEKKPKGPVIQQKSPVAAKTPSAEIAKPSAVQPEPAPASQTQVSPEEIESERELLPPDETMPSSAKLDELDESLEDAVEEINEQRLPTSKVAFKSGMHVFKKNCTMYTNPDVVSAKQGSVKKGRKLWIDKHTDGWHKAYKKSGTVYISADCL